MAFLIHDGYTLEGVVPALGSTPELKFRYRPALPEAVYEFGRAAKLNGKQEMAAVIALLVAHLVDWNVTNQDGAVVPINAESLKRVSHRAQQRMVDVVTGYTADEQGADAKN